MGRGRPPARPQRGLATIEFVLVVPAMFFCIMVVIEFGLWAHASHVATAAAQEGARAARAENGTAAAGQDRARALIADTAAQVLLGPKVNASRGSDDVQVTVDGHAASVLPGVSFPVHAVAAGKVERFRPDGGP
jgi:Flp pilus assembly protein TadG